MERIYEDILCEAVDSYGELSNLSLDGGYDTDNKEDLRDMLSLLSQVLDLETYFLGFLIGKTSVNEAANIVRGLGCRLDHAAIKLKLERL